MTCRTSNASFAGSFHVNIVFLGDVEERVSLVSFDGLDKIALGVLEVNLDSMSKLLAYISTMKE